MLQNCCGSRSLSQLGGVLILAQYLTARQFELLGGMVVGASTAAIFTLALVRRSLEKPSEPLMHLQISNEPG